MVRIVVLGCAGSGKTFFARRLSERIGAQFICLDDLMPSDWTAADIPALRARVAELHAVGRWVSDGNFAAATFDLRLPLADLVIWQERPLASCLWRACARVFHRGEAHRLRNLPHVLNFIAGFQRINVPRIETLRQKFAPGVPVLRLRSDTESENFLNAQ